MSKHGITKIISGGQTGADIGGTDAALSSGIDYGGSIHAGRRTEDGVLPERYDKITEVESKSYLVRTEKNVVDSDATECGIPFVHISSNSREGNVTMRPNDTDIRVIHLKTDEVACFPAIEPLLAIDKSSV
jgi:hypothetical protein